MIFAISALLIASTFASVKAEATARYPAYEAQIQQVGMPSIGYRERLWFNWKAGRFQAGRCDLFEQPQILVVRDKNQAVTMKRLEHEFEHWVAFAAGLPMKEHERIDKR